MSSPTKRPRPSSPDATELQGAVDSPGSVFERTPRQTNRTQADNSGILPPTSLPYPIRYRPESPDKLKIKIKNIPDLCSLAVPVEYTFPPAISRVLGADPAILGLYRKLVTIEHDHNILPTRLQGRIEKLVSANDVLPCMWHRPDPWAKGSSPETGPEPSVTEQGRSDKPDQDDDDDGMMLLYQEFAEIRHLVEKSAQGFKTRFAEAHWNSSVHERVIELALRPTPSVGVMNVTRAAIAEPFRPRLANGDDAASLASSLSTNSLTDLSSPLANNRSDDSPAATPNAALPSSHKMVDFVLLLDTARPLFSHAAASRGDKDPLAAYVDRFLGAQPAAERWINSLAYQPLRRHPAAVLIETKSAAGRAEDGFVQLAVCLAGWHRRMRAILGEGGKTVLSVPVIMVLEGNWDVLFAVDGRGLDGGADEIQIVGPAIRLGNTYSVMGTYRLLAGLRAVAKWMDATFRPWISDALAEALND